jgi:imidazolonepropionase
MSTPVDFILYNAGELVTPVAIDSAQRGSELSTLRRIENAALAAAQGKIVAVGTEQEVRDQVTIAENATQLDAQGRSVIPGFVDPHTHAVFGRARPEEYAARIEGKSYVEIAAAGGGIHSSVRDLRKRSEDDLVDISLPRLRRMLHHGSTTVEIKTGYGLTADDELKTLRAIHRLRKLTPQQLVATFLGAHEIPMEFRAHREKYVRQVIEEFLPLAAPLADFNDVFCEPSVFTKEETTEILRAGQKLGLAAKLHADELASYGAAELACELGAVSADHLILVSDDGIAALGKSDTVAVLLPATSFGLALMHYAPARKLIEAGAAVALATDFNPGSSHCPSMQAAWSLACSMMRMTPAEGLVACTQNAAMAVGCGASVGSLVPGKRCDLVVTNGKDYREVPYCFGVNNAHVVVCDGEVVWTAAS